MSLSIFSRPYESTVVARKYDLSTFDTTLKSAALTALLNDSAEVANTIVEHWDLPAPLKTAAKYGNWAVPMQGTSTGNSADAIRFSWEIPPQYTEWVSTSKGGGYCRWYGLNRYVVLWGDAGEELRRYPGYALRNVKQIDSTALVFSDTGTQDLNVRIKLPGQVFVASGPGIRVRQGNYLSHLAFLNSRLASLVLRTINPKFTIAAGYIKELPFNEKLSNHAGNAALAQACIDAKKFVLGRKLANDECSVAAIFDAPVQSFDEYFACELVGELRHELVKLEAEGAIEDNLVSVLQLPAEVAADIRRQRGTVATEFEVREVEIAGQELDKLMMAALSSNVQFKGRTKSRSAYGIDGLLESLAYTIQAHPASVYKRASAQVGAFQGTKRLFLDDLMHKAVLRSLGFISNREWDENVLGMAELSLAVERCFPDAKRALLEVGFDSVASWIAAVLQRLHADVFLDRPFLYVFKHEVRLIRQVPR